MSTCYTCRHLLVQPDPRLDDLASSAVPPTLDTEPRLKQGAVQFGQLGIGTKVDACVPSKVEAMPLEELADVACGWRHTLAVTAGGRVLSWGRGTEGQLGHRDGLDSCAPSLTVSLLGLGLWGVGQ